MCVCVSSSLDSWFLPFLVISIFGAGDAVWESQPPAVLQSSSFLPNERDRDAAMSSTCGGFLALSPAAHLADVLLLMWVCVCLTDEQT